MTMKSNEYKNSDYYLTAYCLAHGIRLLGVEKPYNDSKRSLFVLENSDRLQKLIQEFEEGDSALVSAKKFVEAQKKLKRHIFDHNYR